MISEEHLMKYQAIYKKRFCKEISREDALEKGTKLINLLKIIFKPMTKEEFDQLAKRRKAIKDL